MIFVVPPLDDTEVANAVDAGVFPEIDENDVAVIFGNMVRNWRSLVEPNVACSEVRCRTDF